jgi:hypothetical protein
MRLPGEQLQMVLRRALRRAGICSGYQHKCRKKGCGHVEVHDDDRPRRCPTHGQLMWPVGIVRNIRFHDLRHTTGSLLAMAGVDTPALQRILRDRDPRLTMSTYVHLTPGFLRNEIDRLSFGSVISDGEREVLVTRLLPAAPRHGFKGGMMLRTLSKSRRLRLSGISGSNRRHSAWEGDHAAPQAVTGRHRSTEKR